MYEIVLANIESHGELFEAGTAVFSHAVVVDKTVIRAINISKPFCDIQGLLDSLFPLVGCIYLVDSSAGAWSAGVVRWGFLFFYQAWTA